MGIQHPINMKIFIVEPDRHFSRAIIHYLRSYPDFEFSVFNTLEKCITHFHVKPDIIILSDDLDGLDRSEILLLLKNRLPQAEVIMTSAGKKIDQIRDYMKQGAFDFIIKNGNSLSYIEMAITSIIRNRNIPEYS
jgi:DNA-binding NtrC family response regulator